ncbi:MAG TPA: c-type cytochrome [Candidatus Cybelea sp.]|nr:c-type cytochrome [Candidatus Cybelea sp.]
MPQNARSRSRPSASARGKQTFASTCASCHGLDGRGGERGPNIIDRPSVEQLSDSEISHIIENGVPGKGMPAFPSLESTDIKAVVAYLRTLQGMKRTAALPGDPDRGRMVFFGKAGCSNCHMVAGQGGFIGSDLSGYAQSHEVEQIRSAIVTPAGTTRQVRLATVTTHDGNKYVGRVRNEDNFSLQLQSLDGTFHFITKSDIEKVEYESEALMPSDYGSTLNRSELNDVVSYLMKAAGPSGSSSLKQEEWEQ